MTRVLVVDDDPSLLELARRRLELEGFHVTTTNETLGTTRRIRELKPDVVIMDQQMPALSGSSLLKVIREAMPQSAPKLVLYSNIGESELAAKAAESGADGYICKSDGMDKLIGKIRDLTKK